jgi:hypothetical protein
MLVCRSGHSLLLLLFLFSSAILLCTLCTKKLIQLPDGWLFLHYMYISWLVSIAATHFKGNHP